MRQRGDQRIKQNLEALPRVREQTYDICRFALQHDVLTIRFVREPERELCRLAVGLNGLALRWLPVQASVYRDTAIRQNPGVLNLVKDQNRIGWLYCVNNLIYLPI